MPRLRYNPLDGKINISDSLTISEVIGSILVERDETTDPARTAVLLDEDSVLYNDDKGVS